jgi:tripartite-type tricarboxylate transporter receptor subunit TctC
MQSKLTLLVACAGVVLALPWSAAAQSWKPVKHVELVAPSAAGGGSDTVARLVQRVLQEGRIIDVPLNVVNKAGAGGTLAWASLNQYAGDGHIARERARSITPSSLRSHSFSASMQRLRCARIRRSRARGSFSISSSAIRPR